MEAGAIDRQESHRLIFNLVIHDAFQPQLLEELADISPDLLGIGHVKLGLKLGDNLAEGTLAVAALKDLESGALQFDGAFREQHHA